MPKGKLMYMYEDIPSERKIKVQFGGGALIQIANRGPSQMMSYLIDTPQGDVVMVDSGFGDERDVSHLLALLKLRGNRVKLWFITHAHSDHFGGLHWILKNYMSVGIHIDELRFSFPPQEWLCLCEPNRAEQLRSFLRSVDRLGIVVRTVVNEETIRCGGMEFEILCDANEYTDCSTINDTSIVFKAKFPYRSVLFLGDLRERAGKRLLQSVSKNKICCDIVQLHKGNQNTVRCKGTIF